MLYSVRIMETPTKKAAEEGAVEKLVFSADDIVAPDTQAALVAAVMGKKIEVDVARMKVLVRPFSPSS